MKTTLTALAKFPLSFPVAFLLAALVSLPARAQGALPNGGAGEGEIAVPNERDAWTFDASTGDSIILREGKLVDGNGGFDALIELYDPAGVLVASAAGADAAEVRWQAAMTGQYTAVVRDGNYRFTGFDDTGTYRLHLACLPGAFIVPPGDEGGDLLNGATHDGRITVGDLDLWSVTANAGDRIIVRLAEVIDDNSFTPYIRLYDSSGVLVASDFGSGASGQGLAAEASASVTVGGTYTVVVSDDNFNNFLGQTATYQLHLAKSSGPFVVGDDGGMFVPEGGYSGWIHVGDLDLWSFCAQTGDAILVQMQDYVFGGGPLTPWIRLYGPAGFTPRSVSGAVTASISFTTTLPGIYTIVASDAIFNGYMQGTGPYSLSISGNSGCPFACVQPAAGLVSWWPGDTHPADAVDGNVGALQGGASFTAARIGQGFYLDGSTGAVSIPDSGNLNLTTAFTWDAWINPNWMPGDAIVMDKEVSGADRTALLFPLDGRLCGLFDDLVNPASVTCSPTRVIPLSQFTHVAMAFDGAAGELRLYANGLRVATGTGVGQPAGNAAPLMLGASPGEGHFFGGIIDDVDVFDRALTDGEIRAIVDAGSAGKCTLCPSPPDCEDGNPCTTDGCHAATGTCTHTIRTGSCEDGNACTTGDTCADGVCVGGPAPDCDDNNVCTADSCLPPDGCMYLPTDLPCDDANACSLGDVCSGGFCWPGPSVDCDDGLDCSAEYCDSLTGQCIRQLYPPQEVPQLDFTTPATFEWTPTPDAFEWNAYRGTIPAGLLNSRQPGSPYDFVCFESADAQGNGATLSSDSSSPPLGTAYFFEVTAENACVEGPLGTDWLGAPRTILVPCPTPP